MSQMPFPDDFVWGAATAAYQIEGATDADGRAPSIWDTFSHTPGRTRDGATGDIACDHYHRWEEDVRLMQALGLRAYRFSVAWSRVLPQGVGPPNERGLEFYDRLVDALLAAEIVPFVTLYHWDLPEALQARGGWASRNTVDAFAEYAAVVAQRLGDRVRHWITHNEPYVAAFVGNYQGRHAPGLRDLPTALRVAHYLLLSHGRALPLVRALSPGAQVGITLDLSPIYPATPSDEDQAAARRFDDHWNRWFLDPLFGHGYPPEQAALYGEQMPPMEASDLAEIAAPMDFLGINYYRPTFACATPAEVEPLGFRALSGEELRARGYEVTEMGWAVLPDELGMLLRRLHDDYAPAALYLTENGAAYADEVQAGAVHDPARMAYLHGHLAAARAAIAEGVPLRGYFAWSLMDNFEWGHGYSKRFGLVYVDYPTQQRLPKASAAWYRRVIAANAIVPPDMPAP